MTPEEKGALLLARHEGKDIEEFGWWGPDHWRVARPKWVDNIAYRVKPEPNREKVTARICLTAEGGSMHMYADHHPRYYGEGYLYATLTFDVIDGNPDPSSLKIEEVG
jgi:hypothetical protein